MKTFTVSKRDELMRSLQIAGISKTQLAAETGINLRKIYNQLDSNKSMNYEFVAKVEQLLNHKFKGIIELMSIVEELLKEFESLRDDTFKALKDGELDHTEINHLEGLKELIKLRLDQAMDELKNHENIKLSL